MQRKFVFSGKGCASVRNISNLTSRGVKSGYIIAYGFFVGIYLASPIFIMEFIDGVIAMDASQMVLFALLYLASFLLSQAASYALSMMVAKVEEDNFIRFFSQLSRKLQWLDLKDSDLGIQELNQQIGQNYEIANPYFFLQPMNAVFSALNILGIFVIMFFMNWQIASLLLVFVPCAFLASKAFEKKMYTKAEENLSNIKDVKDYITDQFRLTREERFLGKKQLGAIDPLLERYRQVHRSNCKTKSVYLYFYTYCFLNLAILLVIVLSGILTYEGVVSIGVLFAFQNYVSQLWNPGECLMAFSADYQQAKPALLGLNALLGLPSPEYSSERIKTIELQNFAVLSSSGKQISKEINFSFQKGNTYVIYGDNGAGKTTIVEAILGFNRRYSGEIRINGKKILSDDMVYISSDAYLSSFYDKSLEKLSSGQKKLAQIRLFLSTDKSVYIFDEPTNFIDKTNRKEILAIIDALKEKNKMVLIVTHDSCFFTEGCQLLKVEKLEPETL